MTDDETQARNMGRTKMRDEVRFLLSAFLCYLCVSPQRYVWVELLSTYDSPHVRESKTVLDSGFHAMDSGFSLLYLKSFSEDLGFRIPIVSGILDSYSCIPDSKAQDSRFQKQNFLRFRILQAKISGILESGFPYMGRYDLDQLHFHSTFYITNKCLIL